MLFIALLLFPLPLLSFEVAKPQYFTPVTDYTSTLTHSEQSYINSRLNHFYDSTSNQIVVILLDRFEGDIGSVAQSIGERWGVGDSNFNNGVVILIKPQKGREGGELFIATGYGVEGALPDAICKRISEEEMIPHFREGNYFKGIVEGLNVIEPIVAGEYSYQKYIENQGNPLIAPIIIFALVALFIYRSSRKRSRPYSVAKGGFPFFIPFNSGFSSNRGSSQGSPFRGRGFGGGRFGGGGAGGRW